MSATMSKQWRWLIPCAVGVAIAAISPNLEAAALLEPGKRGRASAPAPQSNSAETSERKKNVSQQQGRPTQSRSEQADRTPRSRPPEPHAAPPTRTRSAADERRSDARASGQSGPASDNRDNRGGKAVPTAREISSEMNAVPGERKAPNEFEQGEKSRRTDQDQPAMDFTTERQSANRHPREPVDASSNRRNARPTPSSSEGKQKLVSASFGPRTSNKSNASNQKHGGAKGSQKQPQSSTQHASKRITQNPSCGHASCRGQPRCVYFVYKTTVKKVYNVCSPWRPWYLNHWYSYSWYHRYCYGRCGSAYCVRFFYGGTPYTYHQPPSCQTLRACCVRYPHCSCRRSYVYSLFRPVYLFCHIAYSGARHYYSGTYYSGTGSTYTDQANGISSQYEPSNIGSGRYDAEELAEFLLNHGWSHLVEGDVDEARLVFARAMDAAPRDGRAAVGYAIASALVDQHEEAVLVMREALRDDPDALYEVPENDAFTELVFELLSTYQRIPAHSLGELDRLFMIAVWHFLLGDYAEAYFAIDTSIERGDDDESAATLKSLIALALEQKAAPDRGSDIPNSPEY